MASPQREGGEASFASEEEEALGLLLPELRRYLSSEVDGAAIDRAGEIPAAVRAGLARLGLFGMTIPSAYGGAGFSLAAACRVVAEIARVDRSVAIMVGLHAGLGIRGIVDLAPTAFRARWLPKLASGECIASFAATEARAGSSLTEIGTTGRVVGDFIQIDGEKSYVTNGRFASLFTILVRTPGLGGDRAHSLVCVPGDTPGVVRGPEEKKLGIRGSSTVTITFDGARVPLDHVLGTPGKGMDQAHALLAWGRTLMSAGCVGSAQAALAATLAYVRERRQFGHPIGDFAASRAHVAWMAARTYAMEALVRSVSNKEGDPAALEAASALAKVFCSETAFEVCDRAVQLHGALGFLEDTGIPRMLRDTRITRIFEGANDVLLVRIGAATLTTRRRDTALHSGRSLLAERQHAEALERAIDGAAARMRDRWGVGAVRRQLALQRLARAAVCAAAARAVIEGAATGPNSAASVARHGARTLVEEGAEWLGRAERAEADEAEVHALTEILYEK